MGKCGHHQGLRAFAEAALKPEVSGQLRNRLRLSAFNSILGSTYVGSENKNPEDHPGFQGISSCIRQVLKRFLSAWPDNQPDCASRRLSCRGWISQSSFLNIKSASACLTRTTLASHQGNSTDNSCAPRRNTGKNSSSICRVDTLVACAPTFSAACTTPEAPRTGTAIERSPTSSSSSTTA